MAPFVGTWRLDGVAQDDGPILDRPHYDHAACVSLSLYGSADDLLVQVAPSAGLTLAIAADGTFTERADGDVVLPWVTVMGELSPVARPFDGVVLDGGRTALQLRPQAPPSETAHWLPPISRDGPTPRYNDGDTRVHDRVSLIKGGGLHRSIRMVTDEATIYRISLRYIPG